jgi:flagellar biosynthesis/type III secretory pathway M-ring protein FliF/YscJ
MKDNLQGLFEQLRNMGGATKAILALSLLMLAGVIGLVTYNANSPHFRLLYSGLDGRQVAAVQSALAGGGIRYEVSQPPGPFVVQVESAQYYQAQNLVALAGAMEIAPEGIQANQSSASDVFLSAGERQQSSLKREWQELEKQLQELAFVQRARVSTSIPEANALRRSAPLTVAVTLQLRNASELTRGQCNTVAKLVRYRFNIPAENVIISDQDGRSLYDGTQESELAAAANELFDHKSRYDAEIAKRTNTVLAQVFGAGLAHIVVNSEWSHARRESIKEVVDPANKAVVAKTESKTSTPTPSGGAGNSGFGLDNAAPGAQAPGPVAPSTTSEVTQSTVVGKETSLTSEETPELKRLTVSLFLDASIESKRTELEQVVKTAVGFVDQRDAISSLTAAFATLKRDEQGKLLPPPAVEPVEGPSRLTEMMIDRSVEIVAALIFLFVLMKALKRKPDVTAQLAGQGSGSVDPNFSSLEEIEDPRIRELVARRQIDELIKNDPERVSLILSRWVTEDMKASRN